MPIERPTVEGRPAWRYGANGTPYGFSARDPVSSKRAKKRAIRQGLAIAHQQGREFESGAKYRPDQERDPGGEGGGEWVEEGGGEDDGGAVSGGGQVSTTAHAPTRLSQETVNAREHLDFLMRTQVGTKPERAIKMGNLRADTDATRASIRKDEERIRAGKTETLIKKLDAEGKVTEVAKLLSGDRVTDASLKAARELIKGAKA